MPVLFVAFEREAVKAFSILQTKDIFGEWVIYVWHIVVLVII